MDAREIASKIDNGEITTRGEIHEACRNIKFSEIMPFVKKETSKLLLRKKPTRAKSGVSVLALMCKPHDCPGKCIYCPKGANAPQSYTGNEPAAMRAQNNDYDVIEQVKDRLSQYEAIGHDATKIEVIVMGGNFLSTEKDYQDSFIKGLYQGLNDSKNNDLAKLQLINESAVHRCVALTFETRPDVCSDEDVKRMLSYGVTRVELGLQSVYDDMLDKVNRGHDVQCVKDTIKRLKDAGFKVDLHLMPGLPGSSRERDIKMFKTLFSDPGFRPDGLKVYPTLVMKGTRLYDLWTKGDYKPLSDKEAVFIISEGLRHVPPYVRVKRVMRDIPTTLVSAGPKHSNLRQLAWQRMKDSCNCIRCREVGRTRDATETSLSIIDYEASGGRECFISFEDFTTGALVGFARLRLCKEAFLRELHVYGRTTPIGDKPSHWQHKGFGKRLLHEAEELARNNGYGVLKVLSGVGVRGYYRKQGYELKDHYMIKYLR